MEDITTEDVQRLFNSIAGAKATKEKVKMVLNMILEQAVDENLLGKNPLKSKRIRITGKPSTPTKPYSVEQMRFLACAIDKVKGKKDRAYLALHAMHPLRLEEVLGLKWQDVDTANAAAYSAGGNASHTESAGYQGH